MQDLKNQLKHMKGKAVSVNGHVYAIGMDSIAHDVEAEDAEKLLMGKNWETIGPPPDESLLLDDDGEPVTDDDGEPDDAEDDGKALDLEKLDIEELKSMADKLKVSYGPNIGKALLIERIEEVLTGNEG